tara:strand:- start:996 stop:1385 length:390 start_codon:yes stop_codon:yes gene_type:complete
MIYLSLFAVCILVVILTINVFTNEEHVTVSMHSDILNDRTLRALFKAMQQIEKSRGHDLQFLINAGVVDKVQIETLADSIMFNQGEFPGEQLFVDPQDFARLITVYDKFIGPDADDHQLSTVLRTLFKL